MCKKIFWPDYQNCLTGLPNSVLRSFGISPVGDTLPLLDRYLEKKYKNIVLLVLDGLGTCILEGNLNKDGFLRKHFVDSISTVFPPTTVAATTSAICGLQPISHAWFGWDCYYPQVDKNITVFLNTEQGTDKPAADENIPWKYCAYRPVVNRINEAGQKAYTVSPFMPPHPQSFSAVCSQITDLCVEDGSKYIYAYWPDPDSTMHQHGCYSPEAKQVLATMEKEIEAMSETLEDTLLIITADHGHIDGRNVVITDYPAITDCLVRLPSFEPRALNLFVKEEKREQFEKEFLKEFGEDFILLPKEEVIREQLFGNGQPHPNADGMIGDYVAIAVTDLTIFNTHEEADLIRGVHAGCTKDELQIPLIILPFSASPRI